MHRPLQTQPKPTVTPWPARHPALTIAAALLLIALVLLIGTAAGLPAGWWGGAVTR